MTNYAAVWIDHRVARVFYLSALDVEKVTVTVPQREHRRHAKGESGAKEHPNDTTRFFHAVARSLDDCRNVLVMGPSTAKLGFVQYAKDHNHSLESRIAGVETVDHPTDGQAAAFAKKYFHVVDAA